MQCAEVGAKKAVHRDRDQAVVPGHGLGNPPDRIFSENI